MKKLLYGSYEIRLSDDDDAATIAQRLGDASHGEVVVVTNIRGDVWHLVASSGVPIAVVDHAPPPSPVAIR